MLLVAQNEISASVAREKRSFPWPSFLGGNSVTPETPVEDVAEDVSYDTAGEVDQQELQQQQQQQELGHNQNLQYHSYVVPNSAPQQQLQQDPNIVYHYPIWRVHKYNGIDLKPMPVSMLPAHLQPLPVTDNGAVQGSESDDYAQQSELDPQSAGYEIAEGSERVERTIPDELRRLAIKLGLPDLSKLPTLEDAMSLLGATTPEETISIIKELAATESGRELIKQFLQSNNDEEESVDDTVAENEQEQQELPEQQQQQLTDYQQQQLNDYQQQLQRLQKPQEFHFDQQDIQKMQQQQLHEQLIKQNQIQEQLPQQNHLQQHQQAEHQQQLAHEQYQHQQQQQTQEQYQREPEEDHHQHLNPNDVAPHTHSGQNLPAAYGPPQFRHPNQLLLPPTFLSTVGAGLDRAHTDLSLLHNIITTPRPESAGFFQRITHFFKPPPADVDLKQFQQYVPAASPAQSFNSFTSSYQNPHNPNVRIQDHQQFQPQFQSNQPQDPSVNPSHMPTIPIPSIPGLNEPTVDGFDSLLPTLPQLPQVHIPQRFHMPAEKQPAQTYVRVRYPLMAFNPVPDMYSIAQPLDEAKSAAVRDGIGSVETILLEEPRPDISQLPLDNFTAFKNAPQIVNSYGAPALPYTTDDDDDTDTAGSENIASVLRAPNGNAEAQTDTHSESADNTYRVEEDQNENEFRPSDEQTDDVTIQRRISNGPQRISSHDSYATGKINRADAAAVSAAIPTQSPTADVMMRSLPAFGK